MCDCGCGGCSPKKPVLINENLAPKEILSEGLKYHMDNARPLTEHVYRAGSQKYFELWAEARALYTRGILEVQGDDLQVLTETDLGHFGMVDGQKVPLDFPIELTEDEAQEEANLILTKILQQLQDSDIEGRQNSKDLVKALSKLDTSMDFIASALTGRDTLDISVDQDTYGKLASAKESLLKEIITRIVEKLTYNDFVRMVRDDMMAGSSPDDHISDDQVRRRAKSYYNEYLKGTSVDDLFEAKKKAKKNNKKLNKPMRDSSGGKAYKVYVKDPKTKKIKTVRFGSGGLRAKINDKKARNAFAKRHKCAQKKDKTKAGYWSCRLPRYAKLLGLKSNFGGFW